MHRWLKNVSYKKYKNVYEEISNQSKGCARVDFVTDSYPYGINLKEMIQHRRCIGVNVDFDKNTPFPIDFVGISLEVQRTSATFVHIWLN